MINMPILLIRAYMKYNVVNISEPHLNSLQYLLKSSIIKLIDSLVYLNIIKFLINMIKIDDYYKILDHLTYDERTRVNYDHPDAYDIELLSSHLLDLKSGKAIKK